MGHKQKRKMSVKGIFCVKNSCVRKVLCLALLFLLALPVSALASSVEPTPPKPGDINDSGSVDLADVILALQVCAKISPPPAVTIKVEREVNGDGKIGLEEAIYALQVVSGIRSQ